MKKLIVLLFILLVGVLLFQCAAAEAVDWDALIDSGTAVQTTAAAADVAAVIDWGLVLRFIIFGTLSGLLVSVCLVVIFLLPTAVRWLKDKNMLWLAKMLVSAAEGLLGRYTGQEKFEKVCEWFEARGIKVTDTIKQMIYNAWMELNNQMIELGLKEAASAGAGGGTTVEGSDAFVGTDQPVAID